MKKLKHPMHLKYIKISLLFFVGFHAQSQEVIDKIIAKVDDKIVLKSTLERAYLEYLSSGASQAAPNMKCEVLRRLITNKMMVVQSAIDSVFVLDTEVNANLDRRMQMMTQQFGGEAAIEKAYGKSISKIKSEIFDELKEQMIIQKMQAELTAKEKVSPREVKEFFKKIPQDSLPYFTTEVSVGQIIIKAEAGKNQKDMVRSKLMNIKKQIDQGASFSELAKKHSEDPGSGYRGGELGFFGRGQLAPEFEATALNLKLGEVSEPVETQFGMHIIELLEKRGNTFNSRHILISPKPNESDLKKTKNKLDSIRTLIVNDSITFQSAAKEHSEDQITSSAGGFFQDATGALFVASDKIDPNIFFTIDTMKVGNITRPLEVKDQKGDISYRILYYKDKVPPHQANIEQDYQKIAQATLANKKNQRLNEWFDKAKKNVFIQVDDEYNYCNLEK